MSDKGSAFGKILIAVIVILLIWWHQSDQGRVKRIKELEEQVADFEKLQYIIQDIQEAAQKGMKEDTEDPESAGYMYCRFEDIDLLCCDAEKYIHVDN